MAFTLKSYFSKTDTLFYKGIGILMIAIHNYLHWQPGFGIENEADFNPNNVTVFINSLYPVVWTDTLSAIFAFLGHYGVQLFIFFSAYGLSVSFLNSDKSVSYGTYIFKRLKKLYFLLFFGILVYQCVFFIVNGKLYDIEKMLVKIFMLTTSASNFSSHYLYRMFTGPFWFFGLMVQLYIIFPILFKIVKKQNIYAVFSVSFIAIYLLYYLVDLQSDFALFGTVFGHLPELILGIYLAQQKITRPKLWVFVVGCIVFAGSQIYEFLFPLSFLAVTIVMIYLFDVLRKYLNSFFTGIILYIGKISMVLFVVNGTFRMFPIFARLEDGSLRGERIFLYLLLLFICTHFLYLLYSFLTKKFKI